MPETWTGGVPHVTSRPAPNRFATDAFPQKQRYDAWNARFESVNRVTVPDPLCPTLAACSENWPVGRMLFSVNHSSRATFERTPLMARRDGLDHWALRVVRRGRHRFRSGSVDHVPAPREPILFSLDAGWVSDWDDCTWVSLSIPRDAFPDLSAGFASLGRAPLRSPTSGFLADFLTLLEGHLRDATPEAMPALAETTRATLSACLLSGLPRALRPEDVAVAQFERVRGLIRQQIASPSLNAVRLARLAGMSRSGLYRLFEQHGGVVRYIQRMRLGLLHALLADRSLAHLSIAALGDRVGLFDATALSRAFRAQFGYAPRDARSAALTGRLTEPSPGLPSSALAGAEFGVLLRQISRGTVPPLTGATHGQAA